MLFPRRRARLLLCALLTPWVLAAQPPGTRGPDLVRHLLGATPTRAFIECDGPWQYSVDGESWTTLTLPCPLDYQGRFQLRRTFALTTAQRRAFTWKFVALGVNYECDLLVNDQFVTHFVGGSTTCTAVIPEYALRDGDNVLRLTGTNVLRARETAPPILTTFSPRNYGGLYRHAALVGVPPVAITDVTVSAAPGEHGTEVALTAQLDAARLSGALVPDSTLRAAPQAHLPVTVRAEIFEQANPAPVATASAQTTVADFRAQTVRITLSLAAPRPWSTTAPNLYSARVRVLRDTTVTDEQTATFGVRTITVDADGLVLNGAPMEMRGVVYREDLRGAGDAIDGAAFERDIQMIKTLGANCIRLVQPASPLLLALCDEYGLLVFEPIATDAVPPPILCAATYTSLARNALQAMILRDRNHPCVAAWGVGSRLDAARALPYVQAMDVQARQLDTRPIYATASLLDPPPAAAPGLWLAETFGDDIPDLVPALRAWRTARPGEALLLAGYGRIARPDNHNGYSDPQSIEAQARYLLTTCTTLRQERAGGGCIEAFADWRSNRPSILTVESDAWTNTAGLVSYGRDERRLSFDVAKALFTNDKIPTIVVGEDPGTAPVIYIVLGLVFLLLLVYLANNSRRFRENFSRAIFRPFNFFADIRDQRMLSTVQTTILGAITAGTFAIFFSSIGYYLRTSTAFDRLLNVAIPSDVVKLAVARLVWDPVLAVVVLTLVLFTALVLGTLVIRFFAVFVRPRIFFGDAYAIVLWAALPTVLMIPIAMILYRVMMYGPYVTAAVAVSAGVILWVVFRMLRGVAVVFDIPFRRVYTVALGALVLGAAALLYDFDTRFAMLAQIQALWRRAL